MAKQTLQVSEDERQMILMALAFLGKFRPGFREYLKSIADELRGPGMFLDFEALCSHDGQVYGESAISAAFEALEERRTEPLTKLESALLVAYRLDFARWWAGRDRRHEPREEKA